MAPDAHLGITTLCTQPRTPILPDLGVTVASSPTGPGHRPLGHVTPWQLLFSATLIRPAGDSDATGPATLFRGGGHAFPTLLPRQLTRGSLKPSR